MLIDALTAALVLIGGAFTLLGSVGLVRLPDIFTRLHAPTKATTLGVGALAVASMLHVNAQGVVGFRELTLVLFLFLTAPISAHIIAKTSLRKETSLLKDMARRDAASPDGQGAAK